MGGSVRIGLWIQAVSGDGLGSKRNPDGDYCGRHTHSRRHIPDRQTFICLSWLYHVLLRSMRDGKISQNLASALHLLSKSSGKRLSTKRRIFWRCGDIRKPVPSPYRLSFRGSRWVSWGCLLGHRRSAALPLDESADVRRPPLFVRDGRTGGGGDMHRASFSDSCTGSHRTPVYNKIMVRCAVVLITVTQYLGK